MKTTYTVYNPYTYIPSKKVYSDIRSAFAYVQYLTIYDNYIGRIQRTIDENGNENYDIHMKNDFMEEGC